MTERAKRERVTERFERACACEDATASGPRLVLRSSFDKASGSYCITGSRVSLACDRCDTPWTPNPGE